MIVSYCDEAVHSVCVVIGTNDHPVDIRRCILAAVPDTEEKDDMVGQYIGQPMSKDMALFDEASARLTAPPQIARE